MVSLKKFLLTDQVGTLRAVADTSGAIVKRIDYDSFGNIIADSNPSFSVPFGFAGGLHDRDTGLVRFGYRDYSPELGRFTAKDPIDFAGGDTNLYAYVLNDPANLSDPDGRLAPLVIGGIVLSGEFLAAFGLSAATVAAMNRDQLRQLVARLISELDGLIDEIKKRRDEELQACKRQVGTPPAPPDPGGPEPDQRLKWRVLLLTLFKLLTKHFPHH